MRSDFEKWLDDNNMFMEIERKFNQEHNTYEYCAIRWIWESWQHLQSKVDELQKQLIDRGQRFNEQAQRVKDLEHKSGGLQYRIATALDEIRRALNCVESTETECVLRELERALKG